MSLDQSELSLFVLPSLCIKAKVIWRVIYLCLGFFPTLCSKRENKCKHFVPCENLVFENLCLSGIGPNFFPLHQKSINAKPACMVILICFPFCGLKSYNKCWLGIGGLRYFSSPKVNWLYYVPWTFDFLFEFSLTCLCFWLVTVSPEWHDCHANPLGLPKIAEGQRSLRAHCWLPYLVPIQN